MAKKKSRKKKKQSQKKSQPQQVTQSSVETAPVEESSAPSPTEESTPSTSEAATPPVETSAPVSEESPSPVEVEATSAAPAAEQQSEDEAVAEAEEVAKQDEILSAGSEAARTFLQEPAVEVPIDELKPIPALADEPLWGTDPDPVIPPGWRPLIPLLMIGFCIWLMSAFWDDFSYYRVNKVTNLGSVADGCDKNFEKKARHNLFVNIDGILPQPHMTTSGRVKFEKKNYVVVLGCDLFVSVNAKWYKKFQKEKGGRFSAQGRLVKFLNISSLGRLREFYEKSGVYEFTKNTYLLYDKDEPRHHWWMIPFFLLLIGIIHYCLWRFFVLVRLLLMTEEGEES